MFRRVYQGFFLLFFLINFILFVRTDMRTCKNADVHNGVSNSTRSKNTIARRKRKPQETIERTEEEEKEKKERKTPRNRGEDQQQQKKRMTIVPSALSNRHANFLRFVLSSLCMLFLFWGHESVIVVS